MRYAAGASTSLGLAASAFEHVNVQHAREVTVCGRCLYKLGFVASPRASAWTHINKCVAPERLLYVAGARTNRGESPLLEPVQVQDAGEVTVRSRCLNK